MGVTATVGGDVTMPMLQTMMWLSIHWSASFKVIQISSFRSWNFYSLHDPTYIYQPVLVDSAGQGEGWSERRIFSFVKSGHDLHSWNSGNLGTCFLPFFGQNSEKERKKMLQRQNLLEKEEKRPKNGTSGSTKFGNLLREIKKKYSGKFWFLEEISLFQLCVCDDASPKVTICFRWGWHRCSPGLHAMLSAILIRFFARRFSQVLFFFGVCGKFLCHNSHLWRKFTRQFLFSFFLQLISQK